MEIVVVDIAVELQTVVKESVLRSDLVSGNRLGLKHRRCNRRLQHHVWIAAIGAARHIASGDSAVEKLAGSEVVFDATLIGQLVASVGARAADGRSQFRERWREIRIGSSSDSLEIVRVAYPTDETQLIGHSVGQLRIRGL